MLRILFLLPLVLGFGQDDAIRDLIRKLDDADLEVREKAQRDLIEAGPKALEALKKALASESAEVRTRATKAIRAIELEVSKSEACPPYKKFAIKRTGTVGQILDDLARETGLQADAAKELRDRAATVDATTVFQALDQICAGPAPLTYSWGEDGRVKFTGEGHPLRPASYFEGFRTGLTEFSVLRKSDFKEASVSGRISIHLEWEPSLKPIKRLAYEFAGAKDDTGRELEIQPGGSLDAAGPGIFVMAGFGGEADLSAPQSFLIKGFAPEAKSVAYLKGAAKLTFPLARVDVVFEDPQGGLSTTVGDMTIRIERVFSDKIKVEFRKAKGDGVGLRQEILGRLDPSSVKAVDESGKEHAGEMAPFTSSDLPGGVVVVGGAMGGEPVRKILFQATFPNLGGKDLKQFRFKFSDALYERSVPFELKDIKLP